MFESWTWKNLELIGTRYTSHHDSASNLVSTSTKDLPCYSRDATSLPHRRALHTHKCSSRHTPQHGGGFVFSMKLSEAQLLFVAHSLSPYSRRIVCCPAPSGKLSADSGASFPGALLPSCSPRCCSSPHLRGALAERLTVVESSLGNSYQALPNAEICQSMCTAQTKRTMGSLFGAFPLDDDLLPLSPHQTPGTRGERTSSKGI